VGLRIRLQALADPAPITAHPDDRCPVRDHGQRDRAEVGEAAVIGPVAVVAENEIVAGLDQDFQDVVLEFAERV